MNIRLRFFIGLVLSGLSGCVTVADEAIRLREVLTCPLYMTYIV